MGTVSHTFSIEVATKQDRSEGIGCSVAFARDLDSSPHIFSDEMKQYSITLMDNVIGSQAANIFADDTAVSDKAIQEVVKGILDLNKLGYVSVCDQGDVPAIQFESLDGKRFEISFKNPFQGYIVRDTSYTVHRKREFNGPMFAELYTCERAHFRFSPKMYAVAHLPKPTFKERLLNNGISIAIRDLLARKLLDDWSHEPKRKGRLAQAFNRSSFGKKFLASIEGGKEVMDFYRSFDRPSKDAPKP